MDSRTVSSFTAPTVAQKYPRAHQWHSFSEFRRSVKGKWGYPARKQRIFETSG